MRPLPVQRRSPPLERPHNALHRLVEPHTDNALQDRIPELEVHKERHVAPALGLRKGPVRLHVAKRAVQIFRIDPVRVRVQHHAGPEPLAKHLEANHQIGLHHLMVRFGRDLADARGRAPWQELRIRRHIRYQIVHLLRCVGQEAGFGMGRHHAMGFGIVPCDVSGAAREIKGDAMAQRPYVIDQMISAKAIAARIEALAREIEAEFRNTDKLVVVGLLRGSFVFIADLVRELDLPIEVDFLEASSYGDSTESSREVRILKDLRGAIEGRDVLVVEDIVDTGHTMHHVSTLLAARGPSRLKTIALLDKPARREVTFQADWTGFEIPDAFVVGYGIDYAQRNRNLPFIGKVRFT